MSCFEDISSGFIGSRVVAISGKKYILSTANLAAKVVSLLIEGIGFQWVYCPCVIFQIVIVSASSIHCC
jgi:hypothetical protein